MCGRRDWRAADRATARQRRRPLSARPPSQRATQRAACQATNASAPGLGGQLNGQFGAIGLGQRLHDGDRRGRGFDGPAVQHAGRQPALGDLLDDAVRHRACAVAEVEFFARPDSPHVGGVEALVAVDHGQVTDLGQGVDVEERLLTCRAASGR